MTAVISNRTKVIFSFFLVAEVDRHRHRPAAADQDEGHDRDQDQRDVLAKEL